MRLIFFYIITIIFLISCEDNIIVNTPAPLSVHKDIFLFTQPVAQFNFYQALLKGSEITPNSSETKLVIKNISSTTIDSITFYIEVFDTKDSGERELAYVYQDEVQDLIEKSDTLLINMTSLVAIQDDLIDVNVIHYNDLASEFSNVYRGSFQSISSADSSINFIGLVRGYISADGLLQLRLASDANIATVQGGVQGDSLVLAKALNKDDSKISDLRLTENNKLALSGDSLRFEVDFLTSGNTDDIQKIIFNLFIAE